MAAWIEKGLRRYSEAHNLNDLNGEPTVGEVSK